MKKLVIGSRVLHRGHNDFKVVAIQKHPRGVIATFENERYKVKCNAAELVHTQKGDVFFLPGRIDKMPGELTVEQAIAFGLKKGSLSVEAAHRKLKKFKDLIETERLEAEKLKAEKLEAEKLRAERIDSDG